MSALTAALPSQAATRAAANAAVTEPIYLNPSYTPAERAIDLVSRMTTSEKAAEMNSSPGPALPRLGIAEWGWWNEANHGINALSAPNPGQTNFPPRKAGGTSTNAYNQTNTTSYPSDLSLGSTWDPSLVYNEASLISDEARDVVPNNTQNLDFYAPTVNLTRDPRWGRNDESWSEDPTLTANLASQYVDGLQGQDSNGNLLPQSTSGGFTKALATLKHYAANNSEVNRRSGSSNVDQRTLRDYYTAQFASIIQQSHPGSIMSSYNEVNGVPAALNVNLIDTLARETYGFTGYFTSDCDAVEVEGPGGGNQNYLPDGKTPLNQFTRTALSISAGEDLECDAGYQDTHSYGDSVTGALGLPTSTDTFNIGDVDTSVARLFAARISTGEFDAQATEPWVAAARNRLGGKVYTNSNSNNALTQTPNRLDQARKSADESLVLLQNKPVVPAGAPAGATGTPVLPLQVPATGAYKVAVVGYFGNQTNPFLGGYSAVQGSAGLANQTSVYQGLTTALQAKNPGATVDFYKGFTDTSTQASGLSNVDPAAIAAIKNGGYNAVIVVAGTDGGTSAEDHDRGQTALPTGVQTLDLPGATAANPTTTGQAALINQVAAVNPNTVAYLETVGDVNTSSFQNNVPALVWSSYNGEKQGSAFADIVTGAVDPSGKLPFTWYADQSQLPPITDYTIRPGQIAAPATTSTDTYGRTYEYFTGAVSWPFGYGQSYTNFTYSKYKLSSTSADANGNVTVKATVTNSGTAAGSEVAELYATTPNEPASMQLPIKRLMGFDKVALAPGASTVVTFKLPVSKLSFFDATANHEVVYNTNYGLQVGSSSAASDVKLQGTLAVTGTLGGTPTVVNAKPIQSGDVAKNVAQRAIFDLGTVISPQLTVSMNSQQLFGYVTKGQSTALPAGLAVSFTSDHPKVVSVGTDGTLRTVGSGVAGITAKVTENGVTAKTTFAVDVAPLNITSNAAATFTMGQPGTFTVTTATSTGGGVPHLTETGALPAGVTFTDNGDGTGTLAGTPTSAAATYSFTVTASNGVSPDATQPFTLTVNQGATPPASLPEAPYVPALLLVALPPGFWLLMRRRKRASA